MTRLIISALTTSVLALFSFTASTASATPALVPALYDRAYVPVGFDSNDHIQIVGTGIFENGCYRPAPSTVDIDMAKKRIVVGPAAYEYNGLCLQVINKFERVIEIGILPPGDYEVYQKNQDDLLGRIKVAKATTDNPDDFNYAPVSQAIIDERGSMSELIIKGEFPNNCMYVKEVMTSAKNDVIVAQPIIEVHDRQDCAVGYFPFREVVPLNIPQGRYLLHVRSMNANAVNTLVQIP